MQLNQQTPAENGFYFLSYYASGVVRPIPSSGTEADACPPAVALPAACLDALS